MPSEIQRTSAEQEVVVTSTPTINQSGPESCQVSRESSKLLVQKEDERPCRDLRLSYVPHM